MPFEVARILEGTHFYQMPAGATPDRVSLLWMELYLYWFLLFMRCNSMKASGLRRTLSTIPVVVLLASLASITPSSPAEPKRFSMAALDSS